jgi:hypothetical protein
MVLMMARQEAGPRQKWPTTLKRELEKTLDGQGTSLENWHSDSLKKVKHTLSQGKVKQGDEVADEDNDAMRTRRTSVSQN